MLRSAKYGLYGAVLAGLIGASALWHSVDKSVTLYVDGQPTRMHTTAARVSDVLEQAGYRAGRHDLLAPAASADVENGSVVVLRRGRLLRLSVDGSVRDVWTTAPTLAAAMQQLGYSSATFTSVSRSERLPLGTTSVAIRTVKFVTVVHDGTTQSVSTTDTSVGQLMSQLGIDLAAADRVSDRLSAPLQNDMRIVVQRVVNTTTYELASIKFKTVHEPDASLPVGTTQIAQHGKDGQQRTAYALVYVDGKLTDKTKLDTTTVSKPVPQVEKVGTKAPTKTLAASSQSAPRSAAPKSPAPAPISVSPGSAQAIAKALVEQRGWSDSQFSCLVTLWNHESGWRVHASNSYSGAYGIPQALPGSKMASAGPDWQNNATTQIKWGLSYIAARYSTPCGAWSSWLAHGGWYY